MKEKPIDFHSGAVLKSASRNLKIVIGLGAILFALCPLVEAQQSAKIAKIGYLAASYSSAASPNIESFRQGLMKFGYVEGKNITIEYRYAEGKLARLEDLAAELVRLKVDIIVAASTPGVSAAKNTTTEIPIVFHTINDPVAIGIVASLARPGGNITGITMGGAELYGKRLELLKDTVPKLSRAAILFNPANLGGHLNVKETQVSAQVLGLQVWSIELRSPDDIEPAVDAAARAKADAIMITQNPPITTFPKKFIDVTAKYRLPAIYPERQWPERGGLMSYGTNVADSYRQLASYVDRILKGAKPADLPVERPTKLELVINLKTAKQIGLAIPPNVLARADKVIR